jgi:hypothetical protein
MAILTGYPAVESRESVPCLVVVEALGLFPRDLAVAILATTPRKLLLVRIVGRVTPHAGGLGAKKGSVQSPVLRLEGTHVVRGNECRVVAITAVQLAVTLHESEPDFRVIEVRGVEPQQLEITAEVILVTATAIFSGHLCGRMKALLLAHTILQWLMTGQTLDVRSSTCPQLMTVRAVAHAFEVTVRLSQFPR